MAYDKNEVLAFVSRWRGRGYEKGDTQQFWLQILRAIGYEHSDEVLFEHHLPSGGFIDVWLREADVLVEQKGIDIDLDKPEPRQGVMKTPLVQALDYVDELPRLEQPRFVVTCNFETFRIYDRDKYGRSELADNAFEFSLDEFGAHPEYLGFIIDPGNSRLEKEKQVSITAGERIGKLYDLMRGGYLDPDSEESMHALNVLCVRLVFCLYCEDADLFPKDAFYNYLREVPASSVRIQLKRLFETLDTPFDQRDPYDTDVKAFPYVDGGLFRDTVEIPNFSAEMKEFLLEEVSGPVDWSQISPTIFGGIFESTLNPETRRSGGMHYTSPENIHKVIDPLFLDDLKAEFTGIRDDDTLTPRQKINRYKRFHDKLCGLTFLDPACGSGNFLTETYICLRKLEDAVLAELRHGQTGFGLDEDEEAGRRVSLNQFHGIEINDFAVTVAEAALWISRLKANGESSMFYEGADDDFPLHERANIVHANALRIDWNDVVPAEECDFIMGNPPFVGTNWMTGHQRQDMDSIWIGVSRGKLDYVSCWFVKAAEYVSIVSCICKAALVSTNSICQGEQASTLWKRILVEKGCTINFAWKTFVWNNEASDQAHVHVVIVGFSQDNEGTRRLYDSDVVMTCSNINQYLLPAPTVIIEEHSRPLCDVEPIVRGSQATDDGHYLFTPEEKIAFLQREPQSARYFKRFMMGKEFINAIERWCLWIPDITAAELSSSPLIKERVDLVQSFRASSKNIQTQKASLTPQRFGQYRPPTEHYVAFGKVSSQRRFYVPMGFLTDDVIPGDKLFTVPFAGLYHFGVLQSQFHNAWLRTVGGRMKSDYSYSTTIVYNNFIWPEPTSEQRELIEECAQAVLDARDNHPSDSLATLYDPDKMPADLLAAHKALDAAVEAAYGVDFDGDEEKIVAHLFKLYADRVKE